MAPVADPVYGASDALPWPEDEAMFAAPRYGNGFSSGYQDCTNYGQFAFPVDAEKLDGRLSAIARLGALGILPVGRSVGGRPEGARLERVSSRRAFWFSVAIAFLGIEIHNP